MKAGQDIFVVPTDSLRYWTDQTVGALLNFSSRELGTVYKSIVKS